MALPFALSTSKVQAPVVLGHRGARHSAPENTLPAFDLALQEGAQGVEFDVRLSREGEPIVIHDTDLSRVTGGRDHRHLLLLSRHELKKVDLGGGARVPTLAEVLDWAKQRGALLNIELKADGESPRPLVDAVARVFEKASLDRDQVVFSSFGVRVTRALTLRLADFQVAFLFQSMPRLGAATILHTRVRGIHPMHTLITEERMHAWKAAGLWVNTWTVNSPDEARRLCDLGVLSLISDYPGEILKSLVAT
jgi:glycerophosphoryl diester phosphodiesterase